MLKSNKSWRSDFTVREAEPLATNKEIPGLSVENSQIIKAKISKYHGQIYLTAKTDEHIFAVDKNGQPILVLGTEGNTASIAHEMDHFELWEELMTVALKNVTEKVSDRFSEASHRAVSSMRTSPSAIRFTEARAVAKELNELRVWRNSIVKGETVKQWSTRTGHSLYITPHWYTLVGHGRVERFPAELGLELLAYQRRLYPYVTAIWRARDEFQYYLDYIRYQKQAIETLKQRDQGILGFVTRSTRYSEISKRKEAAKLADIKKEEVRAEAKKMLGEIVTLATELRLGIIKDFRNEPALQDPYFGKTGFLLRTPFAVPGIFENVGRSQGLGSIMDNMWMSAIANGILDTGN